MKELETWRETQRIGEREIGVQHYLEAKQIGRRGDRDTRETERRIESVGVERRTTA